MTQKTNTNMTYAGVSSVQEPLDKGAPGATPAGRRWQAPAVRELEILNTETKNPSVSEATTYGPS